MCCWYALELHRLSVDAIQTSAHNICFYKEKSGGKKKNRKKKSIALASLDKSLADLFFMYTLSIGVIPQAVPVIIINLSLYCGNQVEYGISQSLLSHPKLSQP